MSIDLRPGDWRVALAGETCDALITDCPYSSRTHDGQSEERDAIGYPCWTPDDVREFVASWAPRCRGWFCSMTDDVLSPVWRAAYRDAGRLDFAPVPILQHRPRLQGDGPGSGTVWLLVSRPRGVEWSSWGSLPCWYESTPERGGVVVGAKPLPLMLDIVRDYARPGMRVIDPCAGGATTLIAADLKGCDAVGSEVMSETFALATERIDAHRCGMRVRDVRAGQIPMFTSLPTQRRTDAA